MTISSLFLIVETEKDTKYYIKRQDIGIFDPEFLNLQRLKIIINSNRLIYIDVFEFIKYIYTILEDDFIVGESK